MSGVQLIVSDKCLGLYEVIGDFFPEAKWQRCIVHWYWNAFTMYPKKSIREVVVMLKAIHAQEDKTAALEKSQKVKEKLKTMKLDNVADFIESSVDETLSYMDFPSEHWTRLRTNNALERIMKEIRRRPRVLGAFPDGYSAMMLVGVCPRHIAATKWGTRQYLSSGKLYEGCVYSCRCNGLNRGNSRTRPGNPVGYPPEIHFRLELFYSRRGLRLLDLSQPFGNTESIGKIKCAKNSGHYLGFLSETGIENQRTNHGNMPLGSTTSRDSVFAEYFPGRG